MVRDGDHRKAHSTPLIVTDAGRVEMLSAGAKACYAYDPLTGHELWRVQYNDFSSAPRKVSSRPLIEVSAQFVDRRKTHHAFRHLSLDRSIRVQ